jgi:hypothetical protein
MVFWLAEIKNKTFSETRRYNYNELLLCRNEVLEILYTIPMFRTDRTTNMAAIGSSCLWLVNWKEISSLKPFFEINWCKQNSFRFPKPLIYCYCSMLVIFLSPKKTTKYYQYLFSLCMFFLFLLNWLFIVLLNRRILHLIICAYINHN